VVFGEVVSGLEFVSRVASLDVDDKDAPSSYAVEIADSGLLSREEGEKALAEEAERAAEASKAAGAPEAKVAVAE
jgi:hypothetical protein